MTEQDVIADANLGIEQDPDWTARCRRRLQAALQLLANHREPISIQ